ncbi:hypothetical protein [Actinomadura chibensis]|uniref:Uncharacterized protein n=1 Tax=Actinomadura chibensis TaxID=392828 RepID=A0A5D0NHW9_9ACTN|nr:hypothetical protein [Actinomadura chibensis]TYB43939.1 hypothetical protein FXF69_23515 [Actinomadura chibensis]
MSSVQILLLLLALSVALNIAFGTALTSRANGASVPAAVLAGGGAAATTLIIFFTALPAYR